jgi:hypothetical protein
MESHSFLSLPAATMMASTKGTQPSKMNKREATLAFIEVYRSLPELSDTAVTRTRRQAELTKKLTNLMGNPCYAGEHSVQFFVQLFTKLTLYKTELNPACHLLALLVAHHILHISRIRV